jgi:hypothetical protein
VAVNTPTFHTDRILANHNVGKTDLQMAIVAGLDIRTSAWDGLHNISSDDNRSHAVLGHVSIALQRQHTIVLLIENKIQSSASRQYQLACHSLKFAIRKRGSSILTRTTL